MRRWVSAIDPELVAASDEVDRSLTCDTLRLTLRARLDRASATARWIGGFQRASARWTESGSLGDPPASDTDSNGYAEPDTVDYDWANWHGSVQCRHDGVFQILT